LAIRVNPPSNFRQTKLPFFVYAAPPEHFRGWALGIEHARYDLFRKSPEGPVWVGCENNLEKAKMKIAALSKSDGMEYFVYDGASQTVVASTGPLKNSPPD
jgi:hypothetical protein